MRKLCMRCRGSSPPSRRPVVSASRQDTQLWLLIARAALPLIEIGLFVELGGAIGLWPTLAWTVAGVFVGMAVLRDAGARTVGAVHAAMNGLRDPARPAANGALRLAAGVLLALPGFFTDALGLMLLIPPVRVVLLQRIARNRPRPPAADVIDASYRDVTPPQPPRRGP